MRTTLATIIAALGLTGQCFAQQATCGQLVQGVKADRRAYGFGECVSFEYTIENRTNQTIRYDFPSSKQYDLWITRGGDEEIYRMSKGKAYASMMTSVTLKPGEKRSFTAQWNQKDAKGNQCGPGAYMVCAQMTPPKNRPPVTTGFFQIGGKAAALIPVTINESITRFEELSGRRVQISATYRGYSPGRGDENTKDGPPVSRSDWAMCDSTGCMYAVGKTSLDPMKDAGAKITAVGTLKKTAKGQVYMVVESATIQKTPGATCPS